jgi:GntP family gluconate:H+ symporter
MMEIDGIRMLIGLVIGIALLIMLVLKTKVQTFLALIISTIAIGVIMRFSTMDLMNEAV